MKTFFLLFLLLTTNSLSAKSLVAGGGGDSAGGDNIKPESGSAWFLGNRIIVYCMEVDPKFGLAKEEILFQLANAFRVWHDYIGIHRKQGRFGTLQLATQSAAQNTCDGKEDIKFYFGGTNPEIEKSKALYDNPSAFAHRSSFNAETGWGSGYVWVAPSKSVDPNQQFPDWNSPYALHGILLHEIGHVYGNQHIEGTIMSAKVSDLIKYAQEKPSTAYWLMTQIDLVRTLVPSFQFITSGYFGSKNKTEETLNSALFEKLTGVPPKGIVQPQLIYKTNGKYELVLNNGENQHRLFLETGLNDNIPENLVSAASIFIGDGEVFRAFKKSGEVIEESRNIPYGYSALGLIKAKNGKEYPTSIEVNSLRMTHVGGPLTVKIFIEGKTQFLFTQFDERYYPK